MPRLDRSLVFIWDNFGPSHADRAEAVAAAVTPRPVVGIELTRISADYEWVSEHGKGFQKVTLSQRPGPWPLKALQIVWAVLKARPAFVFSCHYERPEIFVAATIIRLLGTPVFMMIDSKFDDYQRRLWWEVVKQVFFLPYRGAMVASRRTADYLRYFGMRSDQVVPGYDSISVDRIRQVSGTSPAPEGLPFEQRHFTIVARLVPKKNISVALRAFARLRQGGSRRLLVICGSGPLEAKLKAEAAALGIADAVRFDGFVQTAAIARTLGSTLALVHPSVEEQFGIAIAEAVAMGVPVLVSENCGARDTLVRTAVNGFVFEPTNVAGLAELMRQIDADAGLWRRLSLGCAPFAAEADTPTFVDGVRHLCGLPRRPIPTRLAPIAIFAFRRPAHLERCLDALEACPEFSASQVFVFIDGPRDEADMDAVEVVRNLVESRQRPNMTVVAREENRGLAASIIEEVTSLVNAHGRVIVIEDDLLVEPTALSWMNAALEAYEDNDRVMQVSAYQYRVYEFDDRPTGVFQRFTTTWGWATWKRAWDQFDPDATGWQAIATPGPDRRAFDAGGNYPFSDMLVKQMSGELDSWGIRWSWTMHKAGGLIVMPPRSLVHNIGFDESATHNSVGWLKRLISGPRPLPWKALERPRLPIAAEVRPGDEVAFRRGLLRTRAARNAFIKSVLKVLGWKSSSTRIHLRMRRVIAVAQLPPPVSGLSVVNAHMVRALREADLLFSCWDVSPKERTGVVAKALDRLNQTATVAIGLLRPIYRRAAIVYMPCDGGWGQIYNIISILFARLSGFELWLHHHSFAYVTRRSGLMALLLKFSPRGARHIFLCQEMADQFDQQYCAIVQRRDHRTHIISNAFTVERPEPVARPAGPLVIGHLSNLTEEKGAVRFIDLFRRLAASGMAVRAEMAGPIHDRATADAVRAAEAEFPDTFKWHGPVLGAAKAAFYDAIEVFVFPTRYVNEAQPVVLLEALAHGCAIISTDRGCIACDHASAPGLVAAEHEHDDLAYQWLKDLPTDQRRAIPLAARAVFEVARKESERQLGAILAEMAAEPSWH